MRLYDQPVQRCASIFGVALAAAFPFLDYDAVGPLFAWMGKYSGVAVPVIVTAILCAIGFGIRKRTPGFYQLRGFGWRDLAWMAFAMGAVFAVVILLNAITTHILPHAPGGGQDSDDSVPLAIPSGYPGAIEAGICEEFIYRGFMIEELGELLRARRVAAGISVVVFGLIHGSRAGGYGWSFSLIVPAAAGIALTVLYFRRRSLPLCMLMHATIDVLNVWANGG